MEQRGRRRKQQPRHRPSPLAAAAGVFGELLLTAGVLVLLFVVYLLWGTGLQTAQAQDDLDAELQDRWSQVEQGTPAPDLDQLDLGDAYGILRIPRFGDDWEKFVVQGVEPADLKKGPGHYPTSADPGEVGNFAIAAHRSGHGEPFAKFPELRVGDLIEIQVATGTYTYRLDDAPDGNSDGNKININDGWVVAPVPGEPAGTEPTEKRITLTTCWPRWGSSHRMYATGVLVSGPDGPAQ